MSDATWLDAPDAADAGADGVCPLSACTLLRRAENVDGAVALLERTRGRTP